MQRPQCKGSYCKFLPITCVSSRSRISSESVNASHHKCKLAILFATFKGLCRGFLAYLWTAKIYICRGKPKTNGLFFINNCYTSTLELQTSVFGCGCPGWKCMDCNLKKLRAKRFKLFRRVLKRKKKRSILLAVVCFLFLNYLPLHVQRYCCAWVKLPATNLRTVWTKNERILVT